MDDNTISIVPTGMSAIMCIMLFAVILVPNRSRQLLEKLFTLPLSLIRCLTEPTSNYIFNFRSRSKTLLNSGGIEKRFFTQSVSVIIVTSIALMATLADLELIVYTLMALGLGNDLPSVVDLFGVNPGDAAAFSLIGSLVVWGIILLDLTGLTDLLPINFESNKPMKRVLFCISILIIGTGIYMMVAMSRVRAEALATSVEQLISAAGNGSDQTQSLQMHDAKTIMLIYASIAILTLFTSIIGFSLIPTGFLILLEAGMLLVIVPVGIAYFIGSICDRFLNVAFNICLAAMAILAGIFRAQGAFLRRVLRVDDTLVDETTQHANHPPDITPHDRDGKVPAPAPTPVQTPLENKAKSWQAPNSDNADEIQEHNDDNSHRWNPLGL